MRVLVVDETAGRAELLSAALVLAGYEVTASLSSPLALLKTIEQLRPDVIVIDTDSPSRDVLEHLGMVSRLTPRPVVMFTSDGSEAAIRAATRAGVAAYVVDGLDENRIKTIVDVAIARFEEVQGLRDQLAEANTQLADRKVIERAKGLLMKSRNLDEPSAYAALRKAAMDRKLKLSEVAQRIVDAADLLGA
ncbi:MAG TPA: ANTAR domain-containing protein [Burkholderiales bacterium]|jgi:response regulator NasT|nr:ANTAR domain-containing protein [Burkholderiales bacterium]